MARRRTGFQKKIDMVHWTRGSAQFAALAAGTQAATLFAAQHLPETHLRLRGEYCATLDGGQANAVGIGLTMGIIMVPEGTGTTVLWSPFTDGDAPWVWWDVAHLMYEEAVVDAVASQNTLSVRRVIDSKAMRKVRNQEFQFVAENTTIQAASAINVFAEVRALAGT